MHMIYSRNINRIQYKFLTACICDYRTPNLSVSPSKAVKRLQVNLLCPVLLQTLHACCFRGLFARPWLLPTLQRLVRRRLGRFNTTSSLITRSANGSLSKGQSFALSIT
jgi:hypothetical protein